MQHLNTTIKLLLAKDSLEQIKGRGGGELYCWHVLYIVFKVSGDITLSRGLDIKQELKKSKLALTTMRFK